MKLFIPIILTLGLTLSGCSSAPEAPSQDSSSSEVTAPDSELGTDYPEDAPADGGTDYVDESATDGDYTETPTDDTTTNVTYFTMPNVVGMIEKDARAAISARGYAGGFDEADNVDNNPRQSCLMTQAGRVLEQYQPAGTQIENSFNSRIKFVVDCRFIVR